MPKTPLQKLLSDAGPLKSDGSDKFFGMENVGLFYLFLLFFFFFFFDQVVLTSLLGPIRQHMVSQGRPLLVLVP